MTLDEALAQIPPIHPSDDTEAVDEEVYRLACEIVLGDDDHDEPCRHGHFDCARIEGGPCSAEQIANTAGRLWRRLERPTR